MSQPGHIVTASNIIDEESLATMKTFVDSEHSDIFEELSAFLKESFSIDSTTDPDIINGYDHDWSNINGNADVLSRPINKFECSVIIKLSYLLKIPITFSAGRTNLTGSATPNGGIIISVEKMKNIGEIHNNKKEPFQFAAALIRRQMRNIRFRLPLATFNPIHKKNTQQRDHT